jgi:hypothetical protein
MIWLQRLGIVQSLYVLLSVLMARSSYAEGCSLRTGSYLDQDAKQYVSISTFGESHDSNYVISYFSRSLDHLKTEVWTSVYHQDRQARIVAAPDAEIKTYYFTCNMGVVIVLNPSDPFSFPRLFFQHEANVASFDGLAKLNQPKLFLKAEDVLLPDLLLEFVTINQNVSPLVPKRRTCSVRGGSYFDLLTGRNVQIIPHPYKDSPEVIEEYSVYIGPSLGHLEEQWILSGSFEKWHQQKHLNQNPQVKNLLFSCDESSGALILMDPSTAFQPPQVLLQFEQGVLTYQNFATFDRPLFLWQTANKQSATKRPLEITDQTNLPTNPIKEPKVRNKEVNSLLPGSTRKYRAWEYIYDEEDTTEDNHQKFFIGVRLASKLEKETFNLYRSLNLRGVSHQPASQNLVLRLIKEGKIDAGTYSVKLIHHDNFLRFVE